MGRFPGHFPRPIVQCSLEGQGPGPAEFVWPTFWETYPFKNSVLKFYGGFMVLFEVISLLCMFLVFLEALGVDLGLTPEEWVDLGFFDFQAFFS